MTVTLSQESYDAMLDDIKKLRERNKDLEDWFNIDDCIDFAKNEHNRQEDEILDIALRKLIKKAQAFDEIREERNWASDAEEYVINVEHIIEELERGE
ncbi:hypothetical protein [Staphylococcus warneri]|uniref:hypothetical protein n=1 Tax=Staphylococcus warneri TaxID=1292 RepID=UPI00073774B5|nr:hypothetical protein [Staphylococcus warneri]KTW16716.1 hypothetical protein SA9_11000 [Staphylococcus warneri]MCC8990564.1 hypothetical protein [Staphylococcus sp.]